VRQEDGSLKMVMDENGEVVPFATWDPDESDTVGPYEGIIKPMRVTLDPGDMLYLPTMWFVLSFYWCAISMLGSWLCNELLADRSCLVYRYHKVSQSCSDEGICCAVNYW
jgi:jumonji domain-containing protein 7